MADSIASIVARLVEFGRFLFAIAGGEVICPQVVGQTDLHEGEAKDEGGRIKEERTGHERDERRLLNDGRLAFHPSTFILLRCPPVGVAICAALVVPQQQVVAVAATT